VLGARKHRVLHLGKFYPPHMGGIEVYLQNLVARQSGVMDVDVLVANDRRRTDFDVLDGARICRVGSLGMLASMPITPTMGWHLRRHETDLIHFHTPNPGGALAILGSGYKGKIVITHHSDTLGREYLKWMSDRFVLRVMERASRIIVTSERYLASSKELHPFRHKCVVIPLGLEMERFENPDEMAVSRIKAEYGDRIIIAVGRLVPFKGFEYLIRAMKNVTGILLLIGAGPQRDFLQECILECGVENRVHLIGNVDNALIPPYYRAASVFVMPSITRAESFGIVQLEAMASGISVVNTDIPSGVPEVSVHGVTGITVSPKDPEALSNAINLLLRDVALRQRFGRAARERVRNGFSAERMVEQTIKLYRSVINE